MGIDERIKEARSRCGWSQAALAREAGLSQSQIGNYETAKATPRGPSLAALAKALEVSEAWLKTGEGSPDRPAKLLAGAVYDDERNLIEALRAMPTHRRRIIYDIAAEFDVRESRKPERDAEVFHFPTPSPDREMTTLRLVGEVAAGQPISAIRSPEECDVPKELARKGRFCLRVRGDSMVNAGIPDRSLVLCEAATGFRWRRGDYVVALVDDGHMPEPCATLKRYVRSRRGVVYLAPESPDHDEQSYEPGSWDIQAKVVGVRIDDEWKEVKR